MAKTEVQLHYQEASLHEVLQFWANNYKPTEGLQFMKAFDGSNRVEWFVDVAQGKVVFKLYLETSR